MLGWWMTCHRCLMISLCFLLCYLVQSSSFTLNHYLNNIVPSLLKQPPYCIQWKRPRITLTPVSYQCCSCLEVEQWGDTFVKEARTHEIPNLSKTRGLVWVSRFQLIRMFLILLSAQELLGLLSACRMRVKLQQDLRFNKPEYWNTHTPLNSGKHIWGKNGIVLSCFPSTPVLMTLLSVFAFNFVPFHQNTFWSEFWHLPKVSGKQKKITSWLMKKKLFCEKKKKNSI